MADIEAGQRPRPNAVHGAGWQRPWSPKTRYGTAKVGLAPARCAVEGKTPAKVQTATKANPASVCRNAGVHRASALPIGRTGHPPRPAGSTRSSSTATALQARISGLAKAGPAHPQRIGLDQPNSQAIAADACNGLPDAIIDGEIVALNATRSPPTSRHLQAAISEGHTDDLVFFRLRHPLRGRGGPPHACHYSSASTRLGEAAVKALPKNGRSRCCGMSTISRRAATRSCFPPANCRWRELSRKQADAPYRSGRSEQLDQGQVPRRPRGRDWSLDGYREVSFRSLIVGRLSRLTLHPCRPGWNRLWRDRRWTALSRGLKGGSPVRNRPFTGPGCAPVCLQHPPGFARSWLPRSNSPAGQPPAWCGRRRSRACGRTSPRPRVAAESPAPGRHHGDCHAPGQERPASP